MEEILNKEKTSSPLKRLFRISLTTIGACIIIAVIFQIIMASYMQKRLVIIRAFDYSGRSQPPAWELGISANDSPKCDSNKLFSTFTNTISTLSCFAGNFAQKLLSKPTSWMADNYIEEQKKSAEQKQLEETIPPGATTSITNKDGSKTYPVQYNNLFGYEFYTSKIDQSGSIDIGSESKQRIAKLLNSLQFPTSLTRNLIFIHIDPTITKPTDKIQIPWANRNTQGLLQPQGGTYSSINGGSIIALNNLVGFNLSVLTHELGHLIGYQLTDAEWKQYYKLRGIPSNIPKSLKDWASSPHEDFAEVYKYTYRSSVIGTSIYTSEKREWGIKTKYGPKEEVFDFSGINYVGKADSATQEFMKNVVSRLSK